jgi:hypothetical protein
MPFPIEIRRGRFSYDRRLIKLENAQGSVGRSMFDGVGVSLDYEGGSRLSVDSARVSLDLQEMEILLHRFENVAAQFANFQSARGSIELERLTLSGVYNDPGAPQSQRSL